MEKAKLNILNSLPRRYKLEWGGKPESPIRFKVFSTKQTVEILNKIWIKAFSKTLNLIFHTYKKYTRSNIPYKKETVTLSIFPNGTIIFQGKKIC